MRRSLLPWALPMVLGVLCVALLVAGDRREQLRHDRSHQLVVATVQSVRKECPRTRCAWESYVRYMIGGHDQQQVKVSHAHWYPGDQHKLLVSPQHPRQAVSASDHGIMLLLMGAAAGLMTILFGAAAVGTSRGRPVWGLRPVITVR